MVANPATSPTAGAEAWAHLVPRLAALAKKSEQQTRLWMGRGLAALLCTPNCLHPVVVAQLSGFQAALAAHLASEGLAQLALERPLARYLDYCYQQACLVYPAAGRASEQYLSRFGELTALAEQGLGAGEWQLLEAGLAEQAGFDAQQMRRATLTERRLTEAAEADARTQLAGQQALAQINQQLKNSQIPESVNALLAEGLVGELQFLLLNLGEEGAKKHSFWQLWQQLLRGVAEVFSADINDQQLYGRIPPMLEQLDLAQGQLPDPSLGYSQLSDALAEALSLRIRKQPLSLIAFCPLRGPRQLPENVKLSASLRRELEALTPGSWYRVCDGENDGMRCKLAYVNVQSGALIFSDFTGRKVLQPSLQAFGAALSAGLMEPLVPGNVDEIVGGWLRPLIDRAARQEQAKKPPAPDEQTMVQLRAAAKAQAEAKALAETKTRVAATPERLQEMAAQLDGAHLGAVFGFQGENNRLEKVKLSVIIKSTGKYIFADSLGQKWAEFSRAELLDALTEGQARILTQGNLFEDQLARVISGLRRDLS